MSAVSRDLLASGDHLKLIQQCGAGLDGVDLQAASEMNIRVANVPTDISGNADSVLINLSRGGLVDRGALEDALASEQIGGRPLTIGKACTA